MKILYTELSCSWRSGPHVLDHSGHIFKPVKHWSMYFQAHQMSATEGLLRKVRKNLTAEGHGDVVGKTQFFGMVKWAPFVMHVGISSTAFYPLEMNLLDGTKNTPWIALPPTFLLLGELEVLCLNNTLNSCLLLVHLGRINVKNLINMKSM